MMGSQILLIIGVLLSGVAVYLAANSFFETIFSPNLPTLDWNATERQKSTLPPTLRLSLPLVHRLILPLIARYKLTAYKDNLNRIIQGAGMGQEIKPDEVVGLQILFGAILPGLIVFLNALFDFGYPPILIVILAVVGAVYPNTFISRRRQERQAQVRLDLPFVVDLLALSTEAGLDFIGAIQKVSEKMNAGPLAEELSQVLRDLKLGSSRADSLNAFSNRLDMSEVKSFVAVLVTADATGTSIGNVLRQQSEQMRSARFTAAEKAGAEASQKIFIPLILFILPAVLLLAFGPVILQFVGGGQ